MNNVDKQYFELVNKILEDGIVKRDRTGTGTKSIFDYTLKFNMNEGFPLLTSKKMYLKGVIVELLWFLKGDTNIKHLVENDCHIWDGDAYKNYTKKTGNLIEGFKCGDIMGWQSHLDMDFSDPENLTPLTKEEFIERIKTNEKFAKKWGNLGPVYGKQWREWSKYDKSAPNVETDSEYHSSLDGPVDQIQNLINDLKSNPDSRRLMVSAWNVSEIDQMTLPPCHYGFQCYTREMDLEERVKEWCKFHKKHISFGEDITDEFLDKQGYPKRKLSLKWIQRSVDVPLGLPYNIASYGILLHLLSQEVNMIPETLIFSGGDCHIYLNQIDGIKKQLEQKTFKLPKISINKKGIFDITYENIKIEGYESSPTVKMPLSN